MRMWLVNPALMCNRHLLGEHVEMHMFVGTIKRRKSIEGYLKNNLVETGKIRRRHDELAKEMSLRGFNHKSPLETINVKNLGKVNINSNIKELKKRCPECNKRINMSYKKQNEK